MATAKLPTLQQRFVEEYLIDGNATQAAIRAGYAKNTAEKKCPLWVQRDRGRVPKDKLQVWDAVHQAKQERAKQCQIDADRVMQEEYCLATYDPADMYDESGALLPVHKMPESIRRAIKSVHYGKNGLKISFVDKGATMVRMHKHFSCCEAEKHDVNHNVSPEAQLMMQIMGQVDGSTKGVLDG